MNNAHTGYLIDPVARTITEVEVTRSGDKSPQKHIGGWIEAACHWRSGETLYVDEAGLFKPQDAFFQIRLCGDTLLAGRGLVVGREIVDEEGEWVSTAPISFTTAQLASWVTFRTRGQADAWAKANASEPASWVASLNTENGTIGEPKVIGRIGALFADIPPQPPMTLDRARAVLANTAGFDVAVVADAIAFMLKETEGRTVADAAASQAALTALVRRGEAKG